MPLSDPRDEAKRLPRLAELQATLKLLSIDELKLLVARMKLNSEDLGEEFAAIQAHLAFRKAAARYLGRPADD